MQAAVPHMVCHVHVATAWRMWISAGDAEVFCRENVAEAGARDGREGQLRARRATPVPGRARSAAQPSRRLTGANSNVCAKVVVKVCVKVFVKGVRKGGRKGRKHVNHEIE